MDDEPLTAIEPDPEPPLLPGDFIAGYGERRALWLGYNVRFQVAPELLSQQVMRVLDRLDGFPRLRLRIGTSVSSSRKVIHAHELTRQPVKYGRKLARNRVVVVLRVVRGDNIHVALEQPAGLIMVIAPVDPWIVADSHSRWKLEFSDLLFDGRVAEAELFDLDEFIGVDWALAPVNKTQKYVYIKKKKRKKRPALSGLTGRWGVLPGSPSAAPSRTQHSSSRHSAAL